MAFGGWLYTQLKLLLVKKGRMFPGGTTRRLPLGLGLPPKHLLKPLDPWQLPFFFALFCFLYLF